MKLKGSTTLVVLGTLMSFSSAFWRMSCTTIQTGRIDPISYPGETGDHVHKIAGASNISPNSTYSSLQEAHCSSCEIQADKSAYWTPLLYYQHPNKTFQEVPANGMTVYYLGRGTNRTNIQPFPPGLSMMSGNISARSYDSTTMLLGADGKSSGRPVADRVSFACLDKDPQKETPYIAQISCANGLRVQVHFPSCWDGEHLTSPDQSHVAYLSDIDNGDCPPGHPVPFVHLFFEVLYGVEQIHQSAGGKFVFSQGDTTGFGFHGDFYNGWDASVLKDAVKTCANTVDGEVAGCDAFIASHTPLTDLVCPPRKPTAEDVLGFIGSLPGNHTLEDPPAFVGRPVNTDGGFWGMGGTMIPTASGSATMGGMSSSLLKTSSSTAMGGKSSTSATASSNRNIGFIGVTISPTMTTMITMTTITTITSTMVTTSKITASTMPY